MTIDQILNAYTCGILTLDEARQLLSMVDSDFHTVVEADRPADD